MTIQEASQILRDPSRHHELEEIGVKVTRVLDGYSATFKTDQLKKRAA